MPRRSANRTKKRSYKKRQYKKGGAKGEFQKVIDYNIKDVELLRDIYYKVIETSKIKWLSGNHNICYLNVDISQLSVDNSLNIPRPAEKDISWMTKEHKRICEWAWRVKPIV